MRVIAPFTSAEFAALVHRDPEYWSAAHGRPIAWVSLDGGADLHLPVSLPCIVAGVTAAGADSHAPPSVDLPPWVDLLVTHDDPWRSLISANAAAAPAAAVALAVLLRAATTDPHHGLATESAVYSMLQAGEAFTSWRAAHPRRPAVATDDPVIVERVGDELRITLHRPSRHNAIDVGLRDALCEALALAHIDQTIGRVVLRGSGPSFCSGGDLDTFGTLTDPADAHLVRLTRSPAAWCLRLAEQTEARVHGACLGGGLELAAFARRVVADPATLFGLPEVSFGLIPGAGGTVSIPARIGRRRTLRLALAATTIDAATALSWGLVDAIEPVGPR